MSSFIMYFLITQDFNPNLSLSFEISKGRIVMFTTCHLLYQSDQSNSTQDCIELSLINEVT